MGETSMTYETLLRGYSPLMAYIIAPILSDPRDREECLADAAMKAWNNLDQYDPQKGSFTTWLTVLTRNTALNRARGIKPTEPIPENQEAPHSNPETIIIEKENRAELAKALNALPHRDRTLFYRKYYYHQSTAQIAAEMGLSVRAVEGRLYRIKKQLKKTLGGENHD